MRIALTDAEIGVGGALAALGYPADEAGVIVPHLIDCELRGLGFSGLARRVHRHVQPVRDRRLHGPGEYT